MILVTHSEISFSLAANPEDAMCPVRIKEKESMAVSVKDAQNVGRSGKFNLKITRSNRRRSLSGEREGSLRQKCKHSF